MKMNKKVFISHATEDKECFVFGMLGGASDICDISPELKRIFNQ